MDFYDRTNELKDLHEKYKFLDSGELCIIYGRRRLGKTMFVRQFLEKTKGKSVFYFVNNVNKKELLDILSDAIFNQIGERVTFLSWEDFFEFLYQKSLKEKFIFVMDEFPRLKTNSPDFLTKFQNAWDEKLSKTKLMFIAIGSSMSMMYDIFIEKTAPLYGRMTWKMIFKPFRYVDFREMFKDFTEEQKVRIFSTFGGTPHFLWFVKNQLKNKPKTSLSDLIKILVLSRTARLRDEPSNFIMMELKKETNYNSVLHSITKTNGSREEIIISSGVPDKDVDYYFNNLIELLSLITRIRPLFYKKRGKPRYIFEDNFFHFWYKYIFPNLSLIELGNLELLQKKIEKDIESFIGKRFEEISRELLILYNGKKIKNLEINFEEIGPWWGKNREGTTEEIDIITNNKSERQLIICEVKWRNEKVKIIDVKKLDEKSKYINAKGTFHYLMISRSGFTPECLKYMKEKNVTHIDLAELEKLFDKAEKF